MTHGKRRLRDGDVSVVNIAFHDFVIFCGFRSSPLAVCINCSFFYIYYMC